jgi:hypothetical protein
MPTLLSVGEVPATAVKIDLSFCITTNGRKLLPDSIRVGG